MRCYRKMTADWISSGGCDNNKRGGELCVSNTLSGFSFKGWADFKKCWHGMKVGDRPTLAGGLDVYLVQNKRFT